MPVSRSDERSRAARSGKTLYPAQVERLFIDVIAYLHTLGLAAVQTTAEKMLVRTSSGVFLDYLGELVGTPRLAAASAQVQIALQLNTPSNPPVTVPTGTVVASIDGRVSLRRQKP